MPSTGSLMPTPRHVDIAVTGRCNLACAYCFYADEMTGRRDLPTAAWLSFFERLGQLSAMTVCLTGGEVFSHPDLFDLIDGLIANRMRYRLLTNATLITEQTIAQLQYGKRRQRLDSIQVSIDGSHPATHDQSRPNSFTRALRGLRLLKAAGLPLTARVTVNRFNVDDLDAIAHLLLDDIGLPSFGTNEAYACGAAGRFESGIMLSPPQRLQAMQDLSRLEKQYPGRIQAAAGPLAFAHEAAKIQQALALGQDHIQGRGCLTACGGVFTQLAVLHDGTIVPCHNLSTLELGNIQENDLGDIWANHPMLAALRQRRQISLDEIEPCRACAYRGFCTGGCPGGAHFLTGQINARSPMDCYRILTGEEVYPPAAAQTDPSPISSAGLEVLGE